MKYRNTFYVPMNRENQMDPLTSYIPEPGINLYDPCHSEGPWLGKRGRVAGIDAFPHSSHVISQEECSGDNDSVCTNDREKKREVMMDVDLPAFKKRRTTGAPSSTWG